MKATVYMLLCECVFLWCDVKVCDCLFSLIGSLCLFFSLLFNTWLFWQSVMADTLTVLLKLAHPDQIIMKAFLLYKPFPILIDGYTGIDPLTSIAPT